MDESTQPFMSSPETPPTMRPSPLELLLPPLACLAFISIGMIVFTLVTRFMARQRAFHVDDIDFDTDDRNQSRSPILYKIAPRDCHGSKVSLSANHTDDLDDPTDLTLPTNSKYFPKKVSGDSLFIPSLFKRQDLPVIDHLRGRGSSTARELFFILLPVVFSLGFCPLTFLLQRQIIKCLYPEDMFSTVPNINDAIGCFLVPAGMVYAICFGFAFQQVSESFKDTALGVSKQVEELIKVLTLLKSLTVISKFTRLSMIRVIKDITLDSLSTLLCLSDQTHSDASEGIEQLLRLLYTDKRSTTTSLKNFDPWQTSVYTRLEQLLTHEGMLSARFLQTRIHPLQWAFLECLGYFTYIGILLLQCSSYRVELLLCLLTVISISLLCVILADLDSPFHGFFQVPLDGFAKVIERLDHEFAEVTAEIMLEKSFEDL